MHRFVPLRMRHISTKRLSDILWARRSIHCTSSSLIGNGTTGLTLPPEDENRTAALEDLTRSFGWTVGSKREFLAKTLQFKSFTDAWSFMSALALHSARVNHHPNILHVYNRVHVQLYTHSQEGTEKISDLDIKMAKFLDRRSRDAITLDHAPIVISANDALQSLMTLKPSPK